MKKALLLFTQSSLDEHEADAGLLIAMLKKSAASQKLAITFDYALYDNLVHIVGKQTKLIDVASGRDLASYDVVYQRRWGVMPDQALVVAIYLDKHGVTYLDSETNRAGSKNKLTQSWRLWEAGLRCPTTVYGAKGKALDWVLEHLDELPFGFPMIMKGLEATRGSDNYLVHDAAELRAKLKEHATVAFLLQEFIPNDCDYRVIVCGNEVRFVLRRIAAKGKHTNNTSQGGSAELVDPSYLSAQVAADCVHAAQVFGRDFAGVDLVYHKETGEHLFFEVNRSPQIESGSYTAEKADVLSRYLYEASA